MKRALVFGFIPYVAFLVGIPFFNSTSVVLGMPLLLLWLVICLLATPLFLWLAFRCLHGRRGTRAC